MRAKQGYTFLAPMYDGLARLVLGKSIQQMQLQFLHLLKSKSKLLIVGGGTGWILLFIDKINSTIEIDYVDLSEGMVRKAKAREIDPVRIRFIVGTEQDIPADNYDCVITNFYLDLFSDSDLKGIVSHIKSRMQPNAYWLVTDFVNMSCRNNIMLKIMYFFFKVTTGLKTDQLPDWNEGVLAAGWRLLEEKRSKSGFIKSVVYQL